MTAILAAGAIWLAFQIAILATNKATPGAEVSGWGTGDSQ